MRLRDGWVNEEGSNVSYNPVSGLTVEWLPSLILPSEDNEKTVTVILGSRIVELGLGSDGKVYWREVKN